MHACAQRYGEGNRVVSLDAESKTARLACGEEIQYDALITTAPLDITLRWLGQPKWADTLSHRRAARRRSCVLPHLWQQPAP
jgi:protoporphyrinogen oxidase